MNRRKLNKRITHIELRDLVDAVSAGAGIGAPLNVFITVHPGAMGQPPADPGEFFRRAARNSVQVWLKRHRCPWVAIWVRENYEGDGREHLHVVAQVPWELRGDLTAAMARWWPGRDVADLRPVTNRHGLLRYLVKQLSPQAWWATGKRVRYQKACGRTGAPVGPVLGKRCGLSRLLRAEVHRRRQDGPRASKSITSDISLSSAPARQGAPT